MLVGVSTHNCFYYPDVVVTCEPTRREQRTLSAPCFVVEVLSPSTSRNDKRSKRVAYTSIDSLQEYVLVHQNRMRVDVYQRAAEGWQLSMLHLPDDTVPISCLNGAISLEEIYRGVSITMRVAEGSDESDEGFTRLIASSIQEKDVQPSPAS